MRIFHQHVNTGLYFDRPIWDELEPLKKTIAVARIANEDVQEPQVDIASKWPNLSLAFIRGPLPQGGETIEQAIERLAKDLEDHLTDPSIEAKLMYVYGPGKRRSVKVIPRGETHGETESDVNFTLTEDGDPEKGRYTLFLSSGCVGVFSGEQITFSKPGEKPGSYLTTSETDEGRPARSIPSISDLIVDLKSNSIGRIQTRFALQERNIAEFGLDTRYTQLKKRALGNPTARSSRFLPLRGSSGRKLFLELTSVPVAPYSDHESYLSLYETTSIKSGFADRAGRDIWLKPVAVDGAMPTYILQR